MNIHDTTEKGFVFSSYPIDMSFFQLSPYPDFNIANASKHMNLAEYLPGIGAQRALVHWNQYLETNDESHQNFFLRQAQWLTEHEVRIVNDAGGWPISSFHSNTAEKDLLLSGSIQGIALSVLVRAYQLTQQETFLETAHRAVRTFECDILDGGVSTPIGKSGIFFEEIAVYPATHGLKGFLFGLFGLFDYVRLTRDAQSESLVHQGLATLHDLLAEFDVGFWTCSDLLHRDLSSYSDLTLQTMLLDALARCSGCGHCLALASRWRSYQQRLDTRLRHLVISRCTQFGHVVMSRVRDALFHKQKLHRTNKSIQQDFLRVCVPISAFPVTGGMRSVLSKIALVTKETWQLEYLTQCVGPNADEFVIHRFGTRRMSPWQFPTVWLYVFAGFWKLFSLLRREAPYDVILLQDGIYTAAFGALVAKFAGVRSICIDHGNLSVLKSRTFRAERLKALSTTNWSHPRRLLARLRYECYWPSLYLLARVGAHLVDHYFIPGAIGDGVEEICKSIGVHPSRITRFANMIDVEKHIALDTALKAEMREKYGIPAEAIVIAIICRLAPEKGLEIALEAISRALAALPSTMSKYLRIIIAGDGPLRQHLEEDIRLHSLSQICLLWGEASVEEVIKILGLSEIFLFTSWRAAGYPLTVLEAMASGCAVIASTESLATLEMLAEGRGVVLPGGDADGTAKAIVQLVSDLELCRNIGSSARNYVAVKHSANTFRRSLMRVTYWSSLDEFLHIERESRHDVNI